MGVNDGGWRILVVFEGAGFDFFLFAFSERSAAEVTAIRQCTQTGRSMGNLESLRSVEKATQCRLAPQREGRTGRANRDEGQ